MIKLSISIVSYKSPKEELEALFESLLASILFLKQEVDLDVVPIYLIDNSYDTSFCYDELEAKQDQFENLKVKLVELRGHGNVGYGRAHNLVLDELVSDLHLILNPDVTLAQDALLNAIKIIHSNHEIKMLSPNASAPSGEKQYLCKRYPSVLTLLLRGALPNWCKNNFSRRLESYEMRELPENKISSGILLVSGCFMLVDTQALKELKGFDKMYFLYFEDFDLSLRMNRLGKVVYAPTVSITHSGGYTSTKGIKHIVIFISSALKFFNKFGWKFI